MPKMSEPILPMLAVDRTSSRPLHKHIYDSFRSAVVRGDLCPGQRLPSSRALAVELGVSRIPVLDAYAQLLAEGYFETRRGAGTFVSEALPQGLTTRTDPAPKSTHISAGPRPVARRALLFPRFERGSWVRGWGAFGVHQPALDRFPFRTWSTLLMRHSRSLHLNEIHRIDPQGSERFREAICTYLRTARAVQCDPHQVMIVAGSQQGLEVSARVLLDPRTSVWMEEPGYRLARNVFAGAGCRIIPVPVDQEGMVVSAGIKRARRARLAYVTPSHQYPLGSTMSASRRMQLLNWAQGAGSWIIEDDYDSEYRFDRMPISSLQGLDRNARVIYVGTFSKVLFPSLRLGYIVIPPDLVDRFLAVRYAMDIFPPYLYQEAIADFMSEGHFARHIRKMRMLYGERRTALVKSLRAEFGDTLQVHGAEAGMHLTVTLPGRFRDREVADRAARQGLWLWPLSPSYLDDPPRQGFILGFGNVPAAETSRAVARLRAVLPASARSARMEL
jgi:GntR family transcriptional regulator/MocR family aminotransferase